MQMSKYYLGFITLVFGLVLISCTPDDDAPNCEDCQNAKEHMYDNLSNNACDPDRMENAVNKMKTACGDERGIRAAYYMAESCCIGKNELHACFQKSEMAVDLIIENPSDFPLADTVDIIYEANGEFGTLIELAPGESHTVNNVFMISGQSLTINVLDHGTARTLLKKGQEITFIRPGKVCTTRTVHVKKLIIDGSLDVEFVNWK
jgi:hypothetical protein